MYTAQSLVKFKRLQFNAVYRSGGKVHACAMGWQHAGKHVINCRIGSPFVSAVAVKSQCSSLIVAVQKAHAAYSPFLTYHTYKSPVYSAFLTHPYITWTSRPHLESLFVVNKFNMIWAWTAWPHKWAQCSPKGCMSKENNLLRQQLWAGAWSNLYVSYAQRGAAGMPVQGFPSSNSLVKMNWGMFNTQDACTQYCIIIAWVIGRMCMINECGDKQSVRLDFLLPTIDLLSMKIP